MKLPLLILLFGLLTTLLHGQHNFELSSYLKENPALDNKVDSIFNSLKDHDKVAQLIMPAIGKYGMSEDTIKMLIDQGMIGGLLLLNGTKDEFAGWTTAFNRMNEDKGKLPFLYSADAEPSLFNRKMRGSTEVKKAIEITTEDEVRECAAIISKDLNEVGVNYNFAPVVDVSGNKTVGYRGFGAKPENILPFSRAFIEETQNANIVATAKHFPGHGLVSGDTHKSLQIINGELKELENYPPLIENGVLSIMIAHIAVKNNTMFGTDGSPASISPLIVTGLLRDSLGFKGLIVTDAMNMGGVRYVKDASLKAIEAGCDIVLMPLDPFETHLKLLQKFKSDTEFRESASASVKRVIRMKICLGLL